MCVDTYMCGGVLYGDIGLPCLFPNEVDKRGVCVDNICVAKVYDTEPAGIHVQWRDTEGHNWHKKNYALSDYPQFNDVDEMQLNPHNVPGMYRDYDTIEVVLCIFLGICLKNNL